MLFKFRLDKAILDNNPYILSSNDSYLTYSNKKTDEIEGSILKAVNGELSAKALADGLFPDKKPHIFISHSSRDVGHAIKLANTLYDRYKIISFIDSQFWGHIDKALKKMHDDYCLSSNGVNYDYTKSNNLLSHMHAILSMALLRVMDNSDSVIFIESNNSVLNHIKNKVIDPKNRINNVIETASPWISSEVSFANTLRTRGHEDRPTIVHAFESAQVSKSTRDSAMPIIVHELNMTDFMEINEEGFTNAMTMPRLSTNRSPIDILDEMYRKYKMTIPA